MISVCCCGLILIMPFLVCFLYNLSLAIFVVPRSSSLSELLSSFLRFLHALHSGYLIGGEFLLDFEFTLASAHCGCCCSLIVVLIVEVVLHLRVPAAQSLTKLRLLGRLFLTRAEVVRDQGHIVHCSILELRGRGLGA